MLQPKICGQWDGHSLWLQWTPVAGVLYAVRVALRKPGAAWGHWTNARLMNDRGFLVHPVWSEGWEAMAEVSVAGTDQWERAGAVAFARSRADFLFLSDKPLSFRAGHKFGAVVDNAACVYQSTEEIKLLADTACEATMECAQPSGWAQLDHAAHFAIRQRGLTIINTAPSENDTISQRVDYVTLSRAPRVSPFFLLKK